MNLRAIKFAALLFGMLKLLRDKEARRYPAFVARLARQNFTTQSVRHAGGAPLKLFYLVVPKLAS